VTRGRGPRLAAVVGAVAGIAAAAGSMACASRPHPPGTIVVALTSSPVNLDPGVGLDEASQKLHALLFSSLLRIDESLRVVPDLATSFETGDWRTFTAVIPAGVTFHDGREMTAEDVAFTFGRFIDPAFASPRKGAYRALASVVATDRYTVVFTLKEPSASFPINLVMGIVPRGTGPDAARRPVGSGPYRIGEFVPDDYVSLVAFDGYFRGRPANDGLVFRVVPDDTMRGLELRKGTVDLVVNDLAPDIVHTLRREGRLQVVTAPGTDFAYIGMNLRDPALADVRVRRAIAYAVDQRSIVEHLRRGLAEPALGIVPPASWAFAGDAEAFPHDPARARALLDEAGYADPDGDGPAPRLRLSLKTSTNEAYRLQAAVLQQQLAQAGIAVDLRSYELATLFADVARGNIQLYTLQFVGVTDPDMLRRVFLSTQTPPAGGFNRGYYADPVVDGLIEAATSALDEGERRDFYQQAQRAIASAVPIVSLWVKTNVAVAQPDLTGLSLSPIADFSFLRHVSRRADAGAPADRKDP
jgi:peptide/nickel transport system substrate-binding protein